MRDEQGREVGYWSNITGKMVVGEDAAQISSMLDKNTVAPSKTVKPSGETTDPEEVAELKEDNVDLENKNINEQVPDEGNLAEQNTNTLSPDDSSMTSTNSDEVPDNDK